jgi:hypothetical protein
MVNATARPVYPRNLDPLPIFQENIRATGLVLKGPVKIASTGF